MYASEARIADIAVGKGRPVGIRRNRSYGSKESARRNRFDSEVFLGDFDGHVALARVRGQVTMSQVRSNDSQFLKISIEALCRGDNSSSKALSFLLTKVTTCVGRATIKRVLVASQMT